MIKRLFLHTMMFGVSAWAVGFDPMISCDNEYSGCNSACDAIENVTSDCYCSCDESYQNCLDIANGYVPEAGEPVAPKAEVVDSNTTAA